MPFLFDDMMSRITNQISVGTKQILSFKNFQLFCYLGNMKPASNEEVRLVHGGNLHLHQIPVAGSFKEKGGGWEI